MVMKYIHHFFMYIALMMSYSNKASVMTLYFSNNLTWSHNHVILSTHISPKLEQYVMAKMRQTLAISSFSVWVGSTQ